MKKNYIRFCAIVIISMFSVAVCIMAQNTFSILPSFDESQEYILHEEELIPWEDATSFLLSDGKIYVYYDASGLVNVYQMDGSFCFGIQIPTIKSGKGDIAYQNGYLYIESRRAIYYVFENLQLVETIELSKDLNRFRSLRELFVQEKNHLNGNCQYQLSSTSNDIVSCDGDQILLDLPEKSQTARLLIILASGMLGVAMLVYEKIIKPEYK